MSTYNVGKVAVIDPDSDEVICTYDSIEEARNNHICPRVRLLIAEFVEEIPASFHAQREQEQ